MMKKMNMMILNWLNTLPLTI